VERQAKIFITGIVQGVGFRPFVYNLATANNLKGFVINRGDATVKIVVEGTKDDINCFVEQLKQKAPAVSNVQSIRIIWGAPTRQFDMFKIGKSERKIELYESNVPPDIAICDECIADILNPNSRWFNYPFTCCSHCGPRFTAIKELPYDRIRTNMGKFPLCDNCEKDYMDPRDRRFHAQGICCPNCGPKMSLYDRAGSIISVPDPIKEAARLLDEGHIVAIKGIGGFHLSAKTSEDGPISVLRKRKNRPTQPFAVMSKDLTAIKTYAIISKDEEQLLTSWRRPIVLLRKSQTYSLSELIAPGLDTIGVMLPYSGIHYILLKNSKELALIMTSGNSCGLPMSITNKHALKNLSYVADYFLLHNRQIINRCDDSVLRVVDNKTTFIRRSRGYIPTPVPLPISNEKGLTVVSLGAELRNVGAIVHRNNCFLTQYIGDVTNLETLNYLIQALKNMQQLFKITNDASVIACDLHPRYLTSRLAEEIAKTKHSKLIKVQHHHAHLASVMAENKVPLDLPVIGIVMDGIGYGTDGNVWGGEIMKASYSGFERLGHLKPQPMPGGDLCTIYPLRMLIAILSTVMTKRDVYNITSRHITLGLPHGINEFDVIWYQIKNEPLLTSSSGRFLDSIAALTGVCLKRTYEGEPAMKVEAVAAAGDPNKIPITPKIDRYQGKYVLDTSDLTQKLAEAAQNGHKPADICACAQKVLAQGVAQMAVFAAIDYGIDTIALSGGVAVNDYIVNTVKAYVKGHGLRLILHNVVPPGDGGLSLGQAVVALNCDAVMSQH